MERSVQAWCPYLLGDIDKLKKVQGTATKSPRGLGNYAFKKDTERRFDKSL